MVLEMLEVVLVCWRYCGHLNDLLEVVLGGEALHRGQGLPAVPLLDPHVHQAVLVQGEVWRSH